MPIHGTAAEMLAVAMIELGLVMRHVGMSSAMLVPVPDGLIFGVAPGGLVELGSMINEIMPVAFILDVPVLVDIEPGSSWGSLE
jgi:DNA polymerase I - 3''-5'' exonuclease and polymerase domains